MGNTKHKHEMLCVADEGARMRWQCADCDHTTTHSRDPGERTETDREAENRNLACRLIVEIQAVWAYIWGARKRQGIFNTNCQALWWDQVNKRWTLHAPSGGLRHVPDDGTGFPELDDGTREWLVVELQRWRDKKQTS